MWVSIWSRLKNWHHHSHICMCVHICVYSTWGKQRVVPTKQRASCPGGVAGGREKCTFQVQQRNRIPRGTLAVGPCHVNELEKTKIMSQPTEDKQHDGVAFLTSTRWRSVLKWSAQSEAKALRRNTSFQVANWWEGESNADIRVNWQRRESIVRSQRIIQDYLGFQPRSNLIIIRSPEIASFASVSWLRNLDV